MNTLDRSKGCDFHPEGELSAARRLRAQLGPILSPVVWALDEHKWPRFPN
jgi:hypothetical protein